jgi:hypothetical protein
MTINLSLAAKVTHFSVDAVHLRSNWFTRRSRLAKAAPLVSMPLLQQLRWLQVERFVYTCSRLTSFASRERAQFVRDQTTHVRTLILHFRRVYKKCVIQCTMYRAHPHPRIFGTQRSLAVCHLMLHLLHSRGLHIVFRHMIDIKLQTQRIILPKSNGFQGSLSTENSRGEGEGCAGGSVLLKSKALTTLDEQRNPTWHYVRG